MNGNATRSRTAAWALLFLAVLCLQNGLMLEPLYFLGLNIPWDFAASYHAVPFFWIEAMKAGVSPDWIPFQGMGYPLYLNSQSGFFYPADWWLVVTQQTNTNSAAVRLRTRAWVPVWQKVQLSVQPTWLETHRAPARPTSGI